MLKLPFRSPARRLRYAAAFRRLCVETYTKTKPARRKCAAAFRRLCVETLTALSATAVTTEQPPSGGCVLKLVFSEDGSHFREQPPSGGCVLKLRFCRDFRALYDAAAFRRLCVETVYLNPCLAVHLGSRLQAAVC